MSVEQKKEKVAAGLLAILLGFIGFHKFYLGYIKQGIIIVCISFLGGFFTFGILAIIMLLISVVEGIVYLSKSQEEFEQCYVNNKRYWF